MQDDKAHLHKVGHWYCVQSSTSHRTPTLPSFMVVFCTCLSLNVDQALSIVAYDGKQCVHWTVLARVFFCLASAHEISFLYLGTVEPRNWDKVRG